MQLGMVRRRGVKPALCFTFAYSLHSNRLRWQALAVWNCVPLLPLHLIQVSSTETGVIFGNIVYEGTGYAERSVVVLNDIHIDIMDYISPASCADVQFRNMWAEFEWENKVRARGPLVVGPIGVVVVDLEGKPALRLNLP